MFNQRYTGVVRAYIPTCIALFYAVQSMAQQDDTLTRKLFPEIIESIQTTELQTAYYLRIHHELVAQSDVISPDKLLRRYFDITSSDALIISKETAYGQDITIRKFRRKHKNIPVEHACYVVLSKSDEIHSIHAEHYILDDLLTTPGITEANALQSALDQLDGELYAWESTTMLLESHRNLPESIRSKLEIAAMNEYPAGQLVIVKDFSHEGLVFDLAYKFEIECVSPFFKDQIYVNAHDGHIMLRDPIIKHGIGDTRYAGERTFPASLYNVAGTDTFQLRGIEPVSGVLCETRNVNGFGGLPLSIAAVYALSSPILDGDEDDPCPLDEDWTIAETGDDTWNLNEHRKALLDTVPLPAVSCCIGYTPFPGTCNEIENDDVALDAQWGASMVAQYWATRHGRNSYDDAGAAIYSFVHYGDAYNNAFWNGSYMTYGDGTYQKQIPDPNGNYAPFTSLDICAHEIGHAICSHTSNLVYQKESGALNESLSDIWAAALERYVLDSIDQDLPYDPYGIGEQIDERDNGLPPGDPNAYAIRWMDDPQVGSNPDTYNGTYYFPTEPPICAHPNLATDYCGVHLNSGVPNKWFYLLTEGSGLPFSPGVGLNGLKASQDDEINDLGNTYQVTGIGSVSAEKITFLAEMLLTPNAQFADMRTASIEASRALFGICSFEEIQTTNAWYAVGVGDTFVICEPRIQFGAFNPMTVSERASETGCDASSTVSLILHSYSATQTIHFTTEGNAVDHVDYELDTTMLTFNGSEIKTLQVTIYDDKIVENPPDTLIISFNDGGYADTAMLIILDDDVVPMIGDTVKLLSETFDGDTMPDEWEQFAVNSESGNHWEFNGMGTASGKAYITLPGSPLPEYNPTAFAHVRLVSPLLDARGRSNVTITFDWVAGGEADVVESTVIFDYGTFQVSPDGLQWTDIEDFVGTQGGSIPDSGTYLQVHSELDNISFFLGFRWYNDGLIGSSFSFTIDNVIVTAEDIDIESDVGDRMETYVPAFQQIAFVSENDNELIGTIFNAQGDLGCTELRIDENDPVSDIIPASCDRRSTKVFELSSPNTLDSLTLTLFFKPSEVDDWENPSALHILAVQDSDIDNLSNGFSIIQNSNIVVDNSIFGEDGYISYTFGTSALSRTYTLTDRISYPTTRIVMNTSDNDMHSLRERIQSACPLDTIRFDPSLIGEIIHLTGPEIVIDKDLVIIGPGIDAITIDGDYNGRVFHLAAGASVVLQHLTLCCGNAMGNGDVILNEGHLVTKGVRLHNE